MCRIMPEDKSQKEQVRRIRIGRLSVDPVFLVIFVFFMTSALLMMAFILFSAR